MVNLWDIGIASGGRYSKRSVELCEPPVVSPRAIPSLGTAPSTSGGGHRSSRRIGSTVRPSVTEPSFVRTVRRFRRDDPSGDEPPRYVRRTPRTEPKRFCLRWRTAALREGLLILSARPRDRPRTGRSSFHRRPCHLDRGVAVSRSEAGNCAEGAYPLRDAPRHDTRMSDVSITDVETFLVVNPWKPGVFVRLERTPA